MCPMNLSFWWNLGSLLMLTMVMQISSGFLVTFYYFTDFYSNMISYVEVFSGATTQLIHSNLPSMIFFFIYLHMVKGLMFSSFSKMNLVWSSGFALLVMLMGISFMGYVLPWGQMSLWGATVIINLITVFPYGTILVLWVWGGYFVSGFTLKVFFSLHFLAPFAMLVLMLTHMHTLHVKGSSNSLSMDLGLSKLEFAPNFTYKDLLNIIVILMALTFIMHMSFNMLDTENFIKANLMVSPVHIKPEWYLLQFYAILRAVPNKLGGVILFAGSLFIILALGFLSSYSTLSAVKPWMLMAMIFISINVVLIWLGGCAVEAPYLMLSQTCTLAYFLWFLAITTILM